MNTREDILDMIATEAVEKYQRTEAVASSAVVRHRRHGRRAPYTSKGIARLPCYRCGKQAEYQWQVCADKRLFRPLCGHCDVALNKMVLQFMGDPDAEAKIDQYAASRMPNEKAVQPRERE